jgi:rhodanese-related sulfurtransferase
MTVHSQIRSGEGAITTIDAIEVRRLHLTRREVALIDLREEDPFAKAHPLFAACLPLSRLELEIYDRVPRRDTLVVLYDDGEGLVARAVKRLARLGYNDVRALQGGLAGWRQAGLELFQDVNSASKAFGELVEARRGTPHVTSQDLQRLIETKADIAIMDARRFDEFRTMSIPTAVSVPGAELVLRARAIAPDPNTPIVVNCAGRTRSIIGAQSLINAGIPNPVRALRNGTIGWTLADQALDHGRTERFPEIDDAAAAEGARQARDVSYRAGVAHIDEAALAALAADATRTLYRFDVRSPEEFETGHVAGFRSAPGGQLVQETDMFAPVRGARIVLADDRGARADMSASWLAQMGWEVYVLDGGFAAASATGAWSPMLPPLPVVPTVSTQGLAQRLRHGDTVVVDLGPSPQHCRGHIAGAWFAVRARLGSALSALPAAGTIVLTSPDGVLARFAVEEIRKSAGRDVASLDGGTNAWVAAGLPLEDGMSRAATAVDDVYRRPYEGTDNPREAMEAYLQWEYGLVDQLARDASHGFHVI